MHHKLAAAALVVLLLEVWCCIFLPSLLHLDPYSIDAAGFNQPPSAAHWLGTDEVGRDLFARVVYGGRVSLLVGVGSTLISIAAGLPLGLLAGYYRGWVQTVIMRCADVFMSVPSMVLILVIVSIFEPSVLSMILIIGLTGWTGIARLICSNVVAVREQEYVEAARASGLKNATILLKYILPNSVGPLWMSIAFRISGAILTESGLSFLGAGIRPPASSWGTILNSAKSVVVISQRPWMWLAPGLCLMVTVACFNLIGETIRDVLDPKNNETVS